MITPNPTFVFDTGVGPEGLQIDNGSNSAFAPNGPADANIAVSSTHICVTGPGGIRLL